MQVLIPSNSSKKEKPSSCAARRRDGTLRLQFPAVVPAVGETAGSVGMTGAVVSTGVGAVVGAVVAAGERVAIGAVVGAAVGMDALPSTEQVQPRSASSSTNSGIKKNRFICASPFGSFSSVCPRLPALYLAGGGKICYTQRMRASISFVKTALSELQANPNRALGQNFCIDGERLSACVDRMRLEKNVIEIGPGLGGLTELLLEKGVAVIAVEKDAAMAAYLSESLPDPGLSVVCGDAQKYRYADAAHPFSVVGNLPYYITTPLCAAVLKSLPESFYCMVQKEAADRFFAQPKDKSYGPLSILTALYYDAETLSAFAPDCFYPSPEVQSVFVGMTKKPDAPSDDPAALFGFCTALLSMRRKTIKNNLKSYPNADAALRSLSIPPEIRAETLPPQDFLALYRIL